MFKNNQKIIHLCISEKFISPLIQLINEHFETSKHHFVITKLKSRFAYPFENVTLHGGFLSKLRLTFSIYRAKKIILHGLYDSHFLYFLAIQPWLLKKCYWVIWGDDLYQKMSPKNSIKQKIKEFFRALLIRNIGHLVTYIEGDYKNAVQWYGAKGVWHPCLAYLSNTVPPHLPVKPNSTKGILAIQVGNSAFQRNNHLLVLEKLAKFKNESIKIYCPLSYGPKDYALMVRDYGVKVFGDKFVPILDFMSLDDYHALQNEIDIGIFAQNHQQAMGNMIHLLGLGKKLYLQEGTTPWELFCKMGVSVYGVNELSLDSMPFEVADSNQLLIGNNFSVQKLVQQYDDIFKY